MGFSCAVFHWICVNAHSTVSGDLDHPLGAEKLKD